MKKYIDNEGKIHTLLDYEVAPNGWTEIIDKYKRFRAPNGDIHTILFDAIPGEGWVEQDIDLLGQPDLLFKPPYDALRMINYPQITEQLDMIWHEINERGSISTDGEWFQSLKNVKENYPKK